MTGLKRLQNDMELVILLSMFEDDIQSYLPPILSGVDDVSVAAVGVAVGGGEGTIKPSFESVRGKCYDPHDVISTFIDVETTLCVLLGPRTIKYQISMLSLLHIRHTRVKQKYENFKKMQNIC